MTLRKASWGWLISWVVFACGSEAEPDRVNCSKVCARLEAKNCVLEDTAGLGGAKHVIGTGCKGSCDESELFAELGGCSKEWNRYVDCLMGSAALTCDGTKFDDIQGCDAERDAWDHCDGGTCDVRDGITGNSSTATGQEVVLRYSWLDCACTPGTELVEVAPMKCGSKADCPMVCCCDGRVGGRVCIDGQCATNAEGCAVLEASPYSLCTP